jgi:2-iminobutanoate/2-iminopropanoate deaminase
MPRQEIRTSEAPAPGGAYSQAVRVGPILVTAGLGPHDPVTRQVVGDDIATQTAQTLRNLEAVLRAAGASLDDVVKTTVHLQDLDRDFAEFNRVYQSFFRPPYPVRTTVGSRLAGILVEIDALAVVERP